MRTQRNGSLAQAMTLLIQNQAAFVAQLGENQRKYERLEARLARVERGLEEIKAVLVHQQQVLEEHSRALKELPGILARLPEAVRQKIGFKPRS